MTYKREYPDWIEAYMNYAAFSEAPRHLHFWTAVSTVAGALRRRVWIDQAYFKWYPNMYVIVVAPPGIVSKSTTTSIGMSLLRKVPGVKFGPDVITWPALVQGFAESLETFEWNGTHYPMCAMTLESSEFGNLINPQDREMVDLFVSLWDGKQGTFEKKTKHSGNDQVVNPWINVIACTTPAWIAGNFPEYMIGGGFTSRAIFVYAEKKEKLVAYPFLHVPADLGQQAERLVRDLEHIATTLVGPYAMTPGAIEFGEQWYAHHYANRPPGLDDERFGGYIARKQTHIHKLAMVLAAATTDEMAITADHLRTASEMVSDLEEDMAMVFSKIGRSETSIYAERLINYVKGKKEVPYREAYRFIHLYIPSMRDFEDVLAGCIRAGQLGTRQVGNDVFLYYVSATP